jgi:hypothetical protein
MAFTITATTTTTNAGSSRSVVVGIFGHARTAGCHYAVSARTSSSAAVAAPRVDRQDAVRDRLHDTRGLSRARRAGEDEQATRPGDYRASG